MMLSGGGPPVGSTKARAHASESTRCDTCEVIIKPSAAPVNPALVISEAKSHVVRVGSGAKERVAMVQNHPFWDRCTTHFRTDFSSWIESEVHWGLTDLGVDPWPCARSPNFVGWEIRFPY